MSSRIREHSILAGAAEAIIRRIQCPNRIRIRRRVVKAGVIQGVESLSSELQPLMVGPRHFEILQESHIDIHVPRTS